MKKNPEVIRHNLHSEDHGSKIRLNMKRNHSTGFLSNVGQRIKDQKKVLPLFVIRFAIQMSTVIFNLKIINKPVHSLVVENYGINDGIACIVRTEACDKIMVIWRNCILLEFF